MTLPRPFRLSDRCFAAAAVRPFRTGRSGQGQGGGQAAPGGRRQASRRQAGGDKPRPTSRRPTSPPGRLPPRRARWPSSRSRTRARQGPGEEVTSPTGRRRPRPSARRSASWWVLPGLRRAGAARAGAALGWADAEAARRVRGHAARPGRTQLPEADARRERRTTRSNTKKRPRKATRRPSSRTLNTVARGKKVKVALEYKVLWKGPLGRLRRGHRRAEHARELPRRVQQDHQQGRLRRAPEADEEEAGRERGIAGTAPAVARRARGRWRPRGCTDKDCCTVFDSFPIPLARAPLGGGHTAGRGADRRRTSRAAVPRPVSDGGRDGPPADACCRRRPTPSSTRTRRLRSVLGLRREPAAVVRARFRNLSMLRLPLGLVGDGSVPPGGVVGGDLLRGLFGRVPLRRPCPDRRRCRPVDDVLGAPGADLGFLQDGRLRGHQVLALRRRRDHAPRARGLPGRTWPAGGSPDARRHADLRRARAVRPGRTSPGRAAPGGRRRALRRHRRGPVADDRHRPRAHDAGRVGVGAAPVGRAPPPASRGARAHCSWQPGRLPIDASLDHHPALRARRSRGRRADDPGACVELARARRTERVSYQIQPTINNACAQPCDTDQRGRPGPDQRRVPRALRPDSCRDHRRRRALPAGAALRHPARGPGAGRPDRGGALGRARIELDYRSKPARAIFSCEPGVSAPAAGRRRAARGCPIRATATSASTSPRSVFPRCAPNGC